MLVQLPVHPNPALYLSPEMVYELALGVDQPYDIAARYGMSQAEFDGLQALDWFGEMVATRRMELERDGQTFAAKARMMAEELYQRLFQHATTGGLAHNLALDMAKQLTELGGMRQKGQDPAAVGAAFQININVGGEAAPPGRANSEVIEVKPVTVTIPKDPLPPRPEGFRVPDFRMTPDLVGNSQAVQAAQAAVPTPARHSSA